MTRQTRGRLFAVLVLLVTLAGVLATPSDQQAAVAVPCCETCELQYQHCLEEFYYPECGGDPTCCGQAQAIAACRTWCNPDCYSF